MTTRKISRCLHLSLYGLLCFSGATQAQINSEGPTHKPDMICNKDCKERPSELDFSPPPMPGFMLKRPDRPLSLDEMVEQARQAVSRSLSPTTPPSSPANPPTTNH